MTAPQVVDARTGPARVRFDDATSSMLRTIKAIEDHPTLTTAAAACIEAHYLNLGTPTLPLDDTTLGWLGELAARSGLAPAAVVRYLAADAVAKFSTPVDAGHPPAPGSPDVEPGQGTTRPPAPTTSVADALALVGLPAHKQPPALTAADDRFQASEAAGRIPPHVHLLGGPCVYGEACDQ